LETNVEKWTCEEPGTAVVRFCILLGTGLALAEGDFTGVAVVGFLKLEAENGAFADPESTDVFAGKYEDRVTFPVALVEP
jgi:hypothetical protein